MMSLALLLTLATGPSFGATTAVDGVCHVVALGTDHDSAFEAAAAQGADVYETIELTAGQLAAFKAGSRACSDVGITGIDADLYEKGE